MPLIPAGQHVRQLMTVLEKRAAPPDSGSCRAPCCTAKAPELGEAAGEALTGPVFTGWQDHRPASQLPDGPLAAAHIRGVVASAYSADRHAWARADPDDQTLLVLVAAVRMTDLRRGLYSIGPMGADAFELISVGALSPDPEGDLEYGGASALLYVCGDLAAACQRGGSGYGALLVRAGAFGHAAWLAAVSAGLTGATYGRASHRITAEAQSLGHGLRHLLTVAIGPSPASRSELS